MMKRGLDSGNSGGDVVEPPSKRPAPDPSNDNMLHARHVEKIQPQERKAYAHEIVEEAVWMYTKGRYRDIPKLLKLVPVISNWSIVQSVQPKSWDERHEDIARLLYEATQKLGGLPVKAMQFVGLRDDIREPYKKWFSKAQDVFEVVSPTEHVNEKISAFADLVIDPRPQKSASIAQVHFGTFQGKDCVVKVQHKHARETYQADLVTMKELGEKVNKYAEANGAKVMLASLSDRLCEVVEQELDFNLEAEAQKFFYEKLGTNIKIPMVYGSTENVLVMERLHGWTGAEIVSSWKRGEPMDVLGPTHRDTIYTAFATMVFKHKKVHIDAHPGNFMVLRDGGVALLDFGQTIDIPTELSNKLEAFFLNMPDREGLEKQDKVKEWLDLVGIKATKGKEIDTANLLFFGAESKLFAVTENIDPKCVTIVLVLLYLSRLENTASKLRHDLRLEDRTDKRAVMNKFKTVLMQTKHFIRSVQAGRRNVTSYEVMQAAIKP